MNSTATKAPRRPVVIEQIGSVTFKVNHTASYDRVYTVILTSPTTADCNCIHGNYNRPSSCDHALSVIRYASRPHAAVGVEPVKPVKGAPTSHSQKTKTKIQLEDLYQ